MFPNLLIAKSLIPSFQIGYFLFITVPILQVMLLVISRTIVNITKIIIFAYKMVFIPPLILIYSALNYYIYHRPLIGYVAKFVLRNPAHETGGGKWRDPVSVDTTQGRLKGSQEFSRSGRTFYWFRGIPYAKVTNTFIPIISSPSLQPNHLIPESFHPLIIIILS